MRIDQKTDSGAEVLCVTGRVDATTASDLEKTVTDFTASGNGNVILDFSGVEYISSAGLRALLIGVKALSGTGRELIIAAPSADVLDVISLTGFTRILKIAPSVAEALPQGSA